MSKYIFVQMIVVVVEVVNLLIKQQVMDVKVVEVVYIVLNLMKHQEMVDDENYIFKFSFIL